MDRPSNATISGQMAVAAVEAIAAHLGTRDPDLSPTGGISVREDRMWRTFWTTIDTGEVLEFAVHRTTPDTLRLRLSFAGCRTLEMMTDGRDALPTLLGSYHLASVKFRAGDFPLMTRLMRRYAEACPAAERAPDEPATPSFR